jgi:uncharacterized membrane protein
MKTRTALIIILITGILMLGAGYYLSGTMGGSMATHWNAAGEADGFGSVFMAFYFLPLLTMALSVLISIIPSIDPLKANVEKFRSDYNIFIVAFALFMFYIQGLTLAWNAGLKFSINGMMAPGFGLFFVVTGLMIRKAKRNYFIGIRTPWTLANDTVWEKTHNLGGQLFIASGVLTMACVFCPGAAIGVLLFTAIGASCITIVYSYLEFRKIEKSATPR